MAKAGDVVGGKYRLIHPLGIGGMGTVWRAEHVDLRQHVAIKLLDARGPELQATLPLKPWVVKPNRSELAKTAGRELSTDDDLIAASLEDLANQPRA